LAVQRPQRRRQILQHLPPGDRFMALSTASPPALIRISGRVVDDRLLEFADV
jgi:hypothetical protein